MKPGCGCPIVHFSSPVRSSLWQRMVLCSRWTAAGLVAQMRTRSAPAVLVWLCCCCAVAAATAQAPGKLTGNKGVSCALSMDLLSGGQGYQLSCSGGSITASAAPGVQGQFRSGASTGVVWVPGSCGLPSGSCTVAICGSKGVQPVTLKLVVKGVKVESKKRLSGIVCIAGDTIAQLPVSFACCLV